VYAGNKYLITESIERFIEGEAFLRSYDSAPHPPSLPLLPSIAGSTLHMQIEKERQLADGEGGGAEGMGMEPNYTTIREHGHL
jgi:hypothetical protein